MQRVHAALLWLASAAVLPVADAAADRVRIEGSEFVLRSDDGRERRSADLPGAELELPNGMRLLIGAVTSEQTPGGRMLWLHRLSVQHDDGSWQPACKPDPDGGTWAFPLPGSFDPIAGYRPDPARFSLTCTSGAQGKCARFGYAPWANAADGTPLLDHYNACIRMVRADYCGDGEPTTRDGTLIDVYDRAGIQQSDRSVELRFEAGWTPRGAVCVQHPRIPEHIGLEQLRERCPRLDDAALGERCTEDAAAERGALLFNRSR